MSLAILNARRVYLSRTVVDFHGVETSPGGAALPAASPS